MKYGGRQEIKDAFMNGFSYETFYMANNVTNYNVIGAANNGGSCIEINSLGKFEFWIRHTETPEGNSSKYLIIGTNVSAVAGKYHHVVCTYDRDAHHAAIYIDGRKAGEADVPNRYAFPNNTDWLAVGGDASARPDPDHPGNLLSDLPLNGEIQIARMYGKALSWEEVFLLYLEAIDGERSGNAPPVSGKKVYISGGTLYIKGFSGSAAVNVYNLPGHKLAEYKAVENHVPVNLAGGIYVVTVSDKGILYKYKVTVK
jgi:hypothetical protein